MKKANYLFYAVLILAFALMLSACSRPSDAKPAEPAQPEAPIAAEEPAAAEEPTTAEEPAAAEDPAPEESAAPELCDAAIPFTAEFGEDSVIAQMSDLMSFTDAEGEYANRVLFTAQRDIKGLRYLEASAELSDDGEIFITEGRTLYTLDAVNTGDIFMITMFLEGYIPDRAIAYMDECGGTHYFYTAISGEDNVPILIPCRCAE